MDISDKIYKMLLKWAVWLIIFCLAGQAGCSRPAGKPGQEFSRDSSAQAYVQEESSGSGAAEADKPAESDPEESTGESPEELPEEELPSPDTPEGAQSVPENYEDKDDYLYGLESEAAVLLRNGVPICGKNAGKEMYPASITKLMTALVAYDHLDLDEVIGMRDDIIEKTLELDLTIAGFQDGDNASVRDYFYGLLVPSGAECAILFAEQVAGTEEDYAVLMNEKAAELGLAGTHFTNPHGAHDDRQVITALDTARLLEAVLENPFLREVVCTPVYTSAPTENYPDGLTFRHVLVLYMRGNDRWPFGGLIYGGKTGTTTPAGKCLVSFAEFGGNTFILATLGAYGQGAGQVRDALMVYERLKDRFEPKEEML